MTRRAPVLPLWLRLALAPPTQMRRTSKPVAVILTLTVGAVVTIWAAMIAGLASTLGGGL